MKQRRSKPYVRRAAAAAGALALTAAFCWWENNGLTLTRYQWSSPKVPKAADGFTIVQVSDLHNHSFGTEQGGLLSLVAQAQPDLIVITGDIIDRNRTDLGPALTFAAGAAVLAPTWYVTGNHEFSVEEGTRQTLFQGLARAGVHLLDDNWAQLELPGGAPLLLAGVSDTALRAGDVQNVLAAARAESGLEEALTLLLAHEPQYLKSYAAAGADLVFCGHAHGGQIRLPAVGGLFAPGQGPLPEYTAGLYQAEETTMLVSRGLGNSVFPLRVFNRPEITALTLRAEGA